jgi:hypothetical protein
MFDITLDFSFIQFNKKGTVGVPFKIESWR